MNVKNFLTRLVANRYTFSIWQGLGLHVVRANFGSPLPDTRELPDGLWSGESSLAGVEMNERGQRDLLATFSKKYLAEYNRLEDHSGQGGGFTLANPFFSSVDAEILYCMVRHFRLQSMVEIGSGYSTLISAKAVLKNQKQGRQAATLRAIEPFPNDFLRRGVPGLTELIPQKVQSVPLSFFDQLKANDILFIDSSHIAKTGSDVCYEFLEIIPRLRKGVVVHVHDIFMPSEYPRHQVVELNYFFNEQYLLQTFLAFNSAFKVLWSGSYMHRHHPAELSKSFSSYNPEKNWPGSFWMQRVR